MTVLLLRPVLFLMYLKIHKLAVGKQSIKNCRMFSLAIFGLLLVWYSTTFGDPFYKSYVKRYKKRSSESEEILAWMSMIVWRPKL